MMPVQFKDCKTLLCLGAHSDDIEIGCGGTVLRLLRENPTLTCHWVVFSAGGRRTAEARRSARDFLGGGARSRVTVAGFRTSFFPYEGTRIKEFVEVLKDRCQPDLILTHFREDRHQDHRVISDLTWNTYRSHLILEYEIPKYDGDLSQPNFFVPLDPRTCRAKVDRLLRHFQSQQNKHWFTRDTFMALLRLRGVECAAPGKYAEAFHSRKLVV